MDGTEADGVQINFTDDSPSIAMSATILSMKLKFPGVKQVSTDILESWINSQNSDDDGKFLKKTHDQTFPKLKGKLVIIDARAEEEYAVGHLPNANRVDFKVSDISEFLNTIPDLASEDSKTIVCYCSVGYRSSVIAQKFEAFFGKEGTAPLSQVDIYNLEGSVFKWANENRPMVNLHNQRTVYTHPFNNIWGKLLRHDLRKKTV